MKRREKEEGKASRKRMDVMIERKKEKRRKNINGKHEIKKMKKQKGGRR